MPKLSNFLFTLQVLRFPNMGHFQEDGQWTSAAAKSLLLSNIKQKSADAENLLTPLLQLKLNGAQVPLTL